MKKIFTLLFCVLAMGLSANAEDLPLVDRCINVLLGNETPTTLMATNLDANNDGVISIADVTTLIDEALQVNQVNAAPAQDNNVDAIVNEIIVNADHSPNISDVNKAVDKNLKK